MPNVRRPRVAIALGAAAHEELPTSWRWKPWTKWGFAPSPSPAHRWAPSLAPPMGRELKGGPFAPTYCEFCGIAQMSWASSCGRASDVSLISCCAVVAIPCCWTPRFALILFWPSGVPSRFEDLDIETVVSQQTTLVASEVAYHAGPLRPAVAGSMAIPGLFRPVLFEDGVLIDGGAVNPLPYDLLFGLPTLSSRSMSRLGADRQSDELHRHLRPCSARRKSCRSENSSKTQTSRA